MKANAPERKIPKNYVKALYIGDSGTGKTSSLMSLLEAGYELRIIDMDNGLDALLGFISQSPQKDELLSRLDYQTFRDKFKASPVGLRVDGVATAYTNALKALTKWDDGSDPSEWGDNTVLVIDSLTKLGRAAFIWANGMAPTAKDPRQWYGTSQDSIQYVIDMLTSENFHANVLVLSHIETEERENGTIKGFASAIGKALGPKLPQSFNTMLLAETKGIGSGVKYQIRTVSNAFIDLKNPMPFAIDTTLDARTGLATIFAKLKELPR